MKKIQYTGGSHVTLVTRLGLPGVKVAPGQIVEVDDAVFDIVIARRRWRDPVAAVKAAQDKRKNKPPKGKE